MYSSLATRRGEFVYFHRYALCWGPRATGGRGASVAVGFGNFVEGERERESSWTNQKKAPRYFSLSSIRPLLFSFLGGEDFRNDETTSKNRREKADEYCRQPLQEMS